MSPDLLIDINASQRESQAPEEGRCVGSAARRRGKQPRGIPSNPSIIAKDVTWCCAKDVYASALGINNVSGCLLCDIIKSCYCLVERIKATPLASKKLLFFYTFSLMVWVTHFYLSISLSARWCKLVVLGAWAVNQAHKISFWAQGTKKYTVAN